MNSEELRLEHLSDDAPLPEILTAEWAADQVMQLFDDLRDGAEVVHVQLRTGDTDASVRLSDAKAAFADGTAQAIQIRYRFESEMWCDTIRPGNPTTQIIRNRLPVVQAADNDRLARAFATQPLIFATGCELGFSDREAIEAIVEQPAKRVSSSRQNAVTAHAICYY